MMQRNAWLPLLSLSTCVAVAGCTITVPSRPTGGTEPAQATGKRPGALATKRPTAQNPAEKPKPGDSDALSRLKSLGRVQVAFKGLGGNVIANHGGGVVANGGGTYQLLQTTAEIARVEVMLAAGATFSQTKTLTRVQMMTPFVSLFFDAVPVGNATLTARAFDSAGNQLGEGSQPFEVARGQVTEVSLNVKLGAPGGVGASITFEDADVEDANITGYWAVGAGLKPPLYPMSGCNDAYVWTVTQFDNSVRATVKGSNDDRVEDVAHRGMHWSEEAYGTIHENRVTMTGRVVYTDASGTLAAPIEKVEYDLTFDPNTWQLRGSRNGQPSWAVPFTYEPGCEDAELPDMPEPPKPPIPPTPVMGQLRGTVYDPSGRPVREGYLSIYVQAENRVLPPVLIQPGGYYSAQDLPTDTPLEITVTAVGRSTTQYAFIQAIGDAPSQDFDFWLEEEATVVPSAPPASGNSVIVSGTVYDDRGATVDGATVTVRSLDSRVPHIATVYTVNGSYVVNNVPEGTNVEVVVTKDGWTSRRRVQSFQQSAIGQRNTLNFGGQPTSADDWDSAYFISDRPEIAFTSPAHDDRGADHQRFRFKVGFSEPLSKNSTFAFERAFALLPASPEAAPDGGPTPNYSSLEGSDSGQDNAIPERARAESSAYALRNGDSVLGSATNKLRATWSADLTEVTFEGDSLPLQTGSDGGATYQAALFATQEWIEDDQGNQLGTLKDGEVAWPRAGELLFNAFKDVDLAGSTWQETHKTAVAFELDSDWTDPALTGVSVISENADLRLELTFSEPMATFKGSGKAHVDPKVYELSRYSFMVARSYAEIQDAELDGTPNVLPGGSIASLKSSQAFGPLREFQFDDQSRAGYTIARGGDLAANPNAAVAIGVSPESPTVVNIWFRNGASDGLFAGYRAIVARVEGVKDPAGNGITATDADRNLAGASF